MLHDNDYIQGLNDARQWLADTQGYIQGDLTPEYADGIYEEAKSELWWSVDEGIFVSAKRIFFGEVECRK